MSVWTTTEERVLRAQYAQTTRGEIKRLLPRHSYNAIKIRAFTLGLTQRAHQKDRLKNLRTAHEFFQLVEWRNRGCSKTW